MKKQLLALILSIGISLGLVSTPCFSVKAEENESETAISTDSSEADLQDLKGEDPEYYKYFDENGNPVQNTQENTDDIQKSRTLLNGALADDSERYIGCDVSRWQYSINWTTAANAGIRFAFVRIGYRGQRQGSLSEDTYYKTNLQGASDAGIRVGAYFYSEAITVQEAIEEADFVLARIKDYNITMPVAIDYEAFTDNDRVKAAITAGALDKTTMTKIVAAFCDRINSAGYTACVYSSANNFETYLNGEELDDDYRLWIASWSNEPSNHTGSDYQFWQYTSAADGVAYGMSSERLDMDYWYDDWTMFGNGDDSSFINSVGTANANQNYMVTINEIPDGYSAETVYVDGVAVSATVSGTSATFDVGDNTARAVVAYKYENSIPKGMCVWTLKYNTTYGEYKSEFQGDLTDLLSYHGFSIRITGKSGIRIKCGIDKSRRNILTEDRLDGYRLVEYGMIAMTDANRQISPMILNGEKAKSTAAYNSSVDYIYDITDSCYRFTSVLVGLPESQYKTEFAFRSYCTLEKDGRQITIYGPIMTRSLSALATQALNTGNYTGETAQYLRQFTGEQSAENVTRISVLGDSISDYYLEGDTTGVMSSSSMEYLYSLGLDDDGAEYPRSTNDVTSASQMWFNQMTAKLNLDAGADDYETALVSGRCKDTVSVFSDYPERYMATDDRVNLLDDNGTPSIIVIEAGTNDAMLYGSNASNEETNEAVPLTEASFVENYQALLNKLHAAYSSAKIVCLSLYPTYDVKYYGSMSNAISQAAASKSYAYYADIQNAVNCAIDPYVLSSDGLHLSALGQKKLGQAVAAFIESII